MRPSDTHQARLGEVHKCLSKTWAQRTKSLQDTQALVERIVVDVDELETLARGVEEIRRKGRDLLRRVLGDELALRSLRKEGSGESESRALLSVAAPSATAAAAAMLASAKAIGMLRVGGRQRLQGRACAAAGGSHGRASRTTRARRVPSPTADSEIMDFGDLNSEV